MGVGKKFVPLAPLTFNIKDLWERKLAPKVKEQLNIINNMNSDDTTLEKEEEDGEALEER